jgi:hypothetical protein
MKAILYLIGLIAVCSGLTWLAFDIHPEHQWNTISSYMQSASAKISSHLSDTTSSASKLKGRLNAEFDQAADVYHGKEKEDPYKYNQTK